MKIPDFRLERYFAKHEFNAPYLMCCSDCESYSVADLFEMDPDSKENFSNLWLGYTESSGHPELREQIASLYTHAESKHILVHSGAEEAIFNFMNVYLEKGDHLIVHFPCYQSLFDVAESIGCEVTRWQTSAESSWALDLDFLEKNLKKNTKAVIVNNPHNPTGYLMVQRTGQEQNPALFQHVLTKRVGLSCFERWKCNRSCNRRFPLKQFFMFFEKCVEKAEVFTDNGQVSFYDPIPDFQCGYCKKFARSAAAYGRVILESRHLCKQFFITRRDPADPQTRESQAFGHDSQADSSFIHITESGQPVFFVIFHEPVNFV